MSEGIAASTPRSVPPAALEIVGRFATLPQVTAIVLAGSAASGWGDQGSDLDLDVYVTEEIPVAARAAIAQELGARLELDNRVWEPGDEWIHAASGRHVDLIYRSPAWIEEQLDRVLVRHEASTGYSTSFWYNVLTAQALFDRDGWFARLQASARVPYPEELRRAIIAKNWPILRAALSSYAHQIELAYARGDRVSIVHRLAALLASYFDILFAVNRQPHPGEKRLVSFALANCAQLPTGMETGLDALFVATAPPGWDHAAFATALDALLEPLEVLLRRDRIMV